MIDKQVRNGVIEETVFPSFTASFLLIKYAVYSKVCVSLSLSPHLISCIQPFHSSLFFPFLLIVVLLMDEPSVVRSPPFKLGLFLAPHVPG